MDHAEVLSEMTFEFSYYGNRFNIKNSIDNLWITI